MRWLHPVAIPHWKEAAMTRNARDQQTPHSGKVENDRNQQGGQDATQLNQGHRSPASRSDRESHVGGSNQSQSRRGPVGGDHSR